ncbi:nucleoside/nucleotide kinase family protein [Promicromonospora iranensis]|uniref:Pantothenate kinase n=1 Tax=Promicromonospora iranensis TaxID=1105144 RepID=A0ABU2CLJ5_9MICO|nr:nucleoside/nucleotide kinase family protein [Promicromonospora iranensis]MDR7382207.1 pantothenate kinase [Promicromonospora iranensis]
MRLTTAELVERAARLAAEATRAGRTQVLGITGAPGAGKSTLAAALVAGLAPGTAVVVGMDGFHLSDVVLEARGSRHRKGAIDTFDDAGYAALIDRIADRAPGGPPVYAPEFRREIEEPIAAGTAVTDEPLVITEGNYLLAPGGAWPSARARMAEVWYVDLPDTERLRRLVARHQVYGKSLPDAEAWAGGTDQRNADLIAATRDEADLIVEWM